MKININHPLTIIRAIAQNSEYIPYLDEKNVKLQISSDEVSKESVQSLANMFWEYKETYGFLPQSFSLELMELRNQKYQTIGNEILETLFLIDLSQYDPNALQKVVQDHLKFSYYLTNYTEAFTFVGKAQSPAEKASVLLERATRCSSLNFTNASHLEGNIWEKSSYSDSEYSTLPAGFSSLDEMLSPDGKSYGLIRGGLYSFMAPPKGGKSLMLSNCASTYSLLGYNVAIASFEMSRDDYFRRIICASFGIPNGIYSAQFMQENVERLKSEKESTSNKKLGNIYFKQFGPANTPQDILYWVLENEKRGGVKIDYVIVDYINLVKSGRSTKSEGTYLSVKQVAEDLRGYGMQYGWATVTATQTNRAAANKLDSGSSEGLTMSDTSESFGLPATADAMVGITRTEDNIFCNVIVSRRSKYDGVKEFKVDWSTWKMKAIRRENPGIEAVSQLKSNSLM